MCSLRVYYVHNWSVKYYKCFLLLVDFHEKTCKCSKVITFILKTSYNVTVYYKQSITFQESFKRNSDIVKLRKGKRKVNATISTNSGFKGIIASSSILYFFYLRFQLPGSWNCVDFLKMKDALPPKRQPRNDVHSSNLTQLFLVEA